MSDIDPRALEAAWNVWRDDTLNLTQEDRLCAVVEAAAPYLLAQGWNAGRLDAQMAPPNKVPTNPYQDQASAS